MRIIIAHPNASYVEATRQVLSVQNENYQPIGATSLQEVIDHFSKVDFDILLIDSELANDNHESFFDALKKIGSAYPTILTVNEDDDMLTNRAKELGVFECVIKRKGYLAALSDSLKRASEIKNGKSPDKPVRIEIEPETTAKVTVTPSLADDEGYFVCDRKGRFLSANKYFQKITGYSQNEIFELAIVDLISLTDGNDFFNNIFNVAAKKPAMPFEVILVNKIGQKYRARLKISLIFDENDVKHIIGFRGNIVKYDLAKKTGALQQFNIDQKGMITEIIECFHKGYSEPIDVLLKDLSNLVCHTFGFKRSTIALLDPRKHTFIKQAMVGYSENAEELEAQKAMEVPQKVIDRIFSDKSHIKVIYHKKEQRQIPETLNHELLQNNSQDVQPIPQWHKRDLIILNLSDHTENTFGYISIDEPYDGNTPTKATFYNLELFSRLVSLSIENYYRFSRLERRNRRLKQILVNSNVFKLYYSLSELLKEVVWSVKFSLDFNMVSLVLISKKSAMLETKAVACDDKVKLTQIRELKYDLTEFSKLLRKEYLQGKSYFVKNEEHVLRHLKRIYYGSESNEEYEGGWPNWALVVVPIKSKEGKIIGFLFADDPNDCRLPSLETIHTLEILANQIAIAIDNRVMYVQAKEKILQDSSNNHESKNLDFKRNSDNTNDYNLNRVEHQNPKPVTEQKDIREQSEDLSGEQSEEPFGFGKQSEEPFAFGEQSGEPFGFGEKSGEKFEEQSEEKFEEQSEEKSEEQFEEQPEEPSEEQDVKTVTSDYFEDADFTKTGFKKLVERFLR